MPAPRKTTEQHRISGQLDARPDRFEKQGRGAEPKPDPSVGNAPRHLTKPQQVIWRELMSEIPPSVATKADRVVIEIAVRMIDRMRNHTAEMRSGDYATLSRCLSQLGMTPADRSKIKVAAAPHVDEWEEDFGSVQ